MPPENQLDKVIDQFVEDTFVLTTYELADKYGKAASTIRGWKAEARSKGHAVGNGVPEGGEKYDQFLNIEGDVIIISDAEMPDHDTEIFDLALSLAEHYQIKTCILNGDAVALDSFSTWAREVELQMTFREEIDISKQVIFRMLQAFEEIYWLAGNHEARLPKATDGRVTMADYMEPLGITFSPYHYCVVNGIWRVTHPDQYSTAVPLSIPRRLARKHHMNIIAAHSHHLGFCYDESGKYLCIDGGVARDESKCLYRGMRDNASPFWNPGFVMIYRNKAYLIPKDCDLDFWLR